MAFNATMQDIAMGRHDRADAIVTDLDHKVEETTGIGLLHIITLASIVGSMALFFSGRKEAGIFVGLWAPTLQALRSTRP